MARTSTASRDQEAPARRRRAEEPETAAPRRRRAEPVEEPAPRRRRTAAAEEAAPRRRGAAAKPARQPRPSPYEGVRPVRDAFTRASLLEFIADRADVDKKQARAVLEAIGLAMAASIRPRGPGKFILPGMLRVVTKHVPATKARRGPDPFNPGQMKDFKAKPATTRVKIRPIKALKECAI